MKILKQRLVTLGSPYFPLSVNSVPLGFPVWHTWVYMDPQYKKDAKLKKESDVYSFGVVMFEMLCGTVAYDRKYAKNNGGLALIARQHINNGKIKEMLDPKIKEQTTESLFTSIKGPSQESLYTFSKIAFECLAKEPVERPTMEVVVKELEKALFFQVTLFSNYRTLLLHQVSHLFFGGLELPIYVKYPILEVN
ncbi:putative protein kinase RLK-Pelle-WAK-LRK10L-1 family [Helianthus anomalus]